MPLCVKYLPVVKQSTINSIMILFLCRSWSPSAYVCTCTHTSVVCQPLLHFKWQPRSLQYIWPWKWKLIWKSTKKCNNIDKDALYNLLSMTPFKEAVVRWGRSFLPKMVPCPLSRLLMMKILHSAGPQQATIPENPFCQVAEFHF